MDQERLTYAAHVQAGGIHWRLLEPYIEPYMHLAGMTGTIDMDLALRGDAEDDMDFALKGVIGTSGFGMLDPDSVKILGLERFDLVIDTADVKAGSTGCGAWCWTNRTCSPSCTTVRTTSPGCSWRRTAPGTPRRRRNWGTTREPFSIPCPLREAGGRELRHHELQRWTRSGCTMAP